MDDVTSEGAPPRRAASRTMADIARLAGVSESTVSRALADNKLIAPQTRLRIQELARSTGFAVNPAASSLRSRRSSAVMVVITLIHDRSQHVSDPFMMTMLGHVADALTSAGYDMLLCKVSEHEDGWIERLFHTRRPAGALLIGQSLEHDAIESAARAGLPIVAWGARLERQSYPSVGTDNRQGGRLAAGHLLDSGRRRVAFLGDLRLPEIAHRHEGFLRAHAERGLAPLAAAPSGFSPAEAAAATRALVAGHGPGGLDAIVAASDVIAMSAIRALGSAGLRAPEDVAVTGFDDIDIAAFTTPALTTVRQDLAAGARLLVRQMLDVVAGLPVRSVEMPAELVVRESAPHQPGHAVAGQGRAR